MKIKQNIKELIICIIIPLAVGLVSSLLSMNARDMFQSLNKPPLAPPAWFFPVVWTVLYILMGVASYLIVREGMEKEEVQKALDTYLLQLFFNFGWSIIFFNFGWRLFAFAWLAAMWALIIKMMNQFKPINKTSFYLMLPYIIWVTFAGYLNLGFFLLN